MGINIITYSGKTRTAKHDAIVYDAALDRSGILNGCNVTANNNVITVSVGYGIIKGRVFEVTEESFTLSLPGSGTQYGALIATLDLSSETLIQLETISGGSSTFTLTENENANFDSGRYQIIIASYTLTATAVTNIKKGHCIPADGMGSKDFNDYVKNGRYYFNDLTGFSNIPTGVSNGWLDVFEARYPEGKTSSVKQIFHRTGSTDTYYHTFVRTRTGTTWRGWQRVVMVKDLATENALSSNLFLGNTTWTIGCIATVNNSYRRLGLHVSSGKNAGLWDVGNENWILKSADNGDVTIPHKLIVSSFEPSQMTVGDKTATSTKYLGVINKYRHIRLLSSSGENAGIYDVANDKWIIYSQKNGVVGTPAPIKAPSSFVRGSTSLSHKKANEAVYKDVTWSEMGGVPTVIAVPNTTVPEKVSVGVTNVTKTGCRIYMTRSDSPGGSTTIYYIAVYTA